MELSISEPVGESDDIFFQWAVTPRLIVIVLINRTKTVCTLQGRDWEGKQLWQNNISDKSPWGLAIGDESIFLGSSSGAVQEFDLSTGAVAPFVYFLDDFKSATHIISTAHDPSGALLIIVGTMDGCIDVWEHASKSRRLHLSGVHMKPVFAFHVSGNVLVSTGGQFVALWDLSTGEIVEKYSCEDSEGASLFVTLLIGDGILATGGLGGMIRLYDRKTGKMIATLPTNASALNGLILYEPTVLLSTDTSGKVCLWSLDSFEPISHVKSHDKSVLTRNVFKNKIFTSGKEGGGAANVCGLDCSLKSCDLDLLLQGQDVRPVEHGFPCQWVWGMDVVGEKLLVCLRKKGKPYLEFWNLN